MKYLEQWLLIKCLWSTRAWDVPYYILALHWKPQMLPSKKVCLYYCLYYIYYSIIFILYYIYIYLLYLLFMFQLWFLVGGTGKVQLLPSVLLFSDAGWKNHVRKPFKESFGLNSPLFVVPEKRKIKVDIRKVWYDHHEVSEYIISRNCGDH